MRKRKSRLALFPFTQNDSNKLFVMITVFLKTTDYSILWFSEFFRIIFAFVDLKEAHGYNANDPAYKQTGNKFQHRSIPPSSG